MQKQVKKTEPKVSYENVDQSNKNIQKKKTQDKFSSYKDQDGSENLVNNSFSQN